MSHAVIVCGGAVVQIRKTGQCHGLCAELEARLVVAYDASPYYDPTVYCACGDSWADCLAERPFRRGWRKAAQEHFEAAWAKAAPEGSRVLRNDELYVTGVETPTTNGEHADD